MNQINIYNNESSFVFQINKVKYMLGFNYLLKYQFLQIIRQFYSRMNSEKREEYGIVNHILVDNEEINPRSSMLWEIKDTYSLTEDLKLGAKSLVTMYLETKMQNTLYFDSMNTIEILFNSLEEEINDNDEINVLFNSINAKTLLKFMKAIIRVEDLQLDEYDLSCEQIIMLQIKMITYIMQHKVFNSNPIVIVHISELTQEINEAIWNIPNVCVFIFMDEYNPIINTKYITLFEFNFVDCEDLESIYQIVDQRYCKLVLLNDLEEHMKTYLMKYYSKEHTNILEYIANTCTQ